MPVRIVDASALGAIIFNEPKAEDVVRILSDQPLVAPALLRFELASICLRKIIFHPLQKVQILTSFELAKRLPVELVEVDHEEIIELAEKTNLTSYDANYLWLAIHLGGELITLDKKLLKTASHYGVSEK